MLVIIRGLPGSGKSTLAKMFEAQGYVHVERDKLRYNDAGEYKYDRSKNEALRAQVGDTAYIMLKAGWDVVVSDCNETLMDCEEFIQMATTLEIPWTVIETKGRFGSKYGSDEEVGIPRRAAQWEHFPVL